MNILERVVDDGSKELPPLRPPIEAMVPIETLVTVGTITLAAGDISVRILKEFYTQVLGMKFVDGDGGRLRFRHQQREIVLERECGEQRRAGFMIRGFGAALIRLRGRKIPYELLHTDSGLTRVAILRDPAGNWIHLLETRMF